MTETAIIERGANDPAYMQPAIVKNMQLVVPVRFVTIEVAEVLTGYTKAHLARELGYQVPALQLRRDRVTARNAYDVQQLHQRLRRVPAAASIGRTPRIQRPHGQEGRGPAARWPHA